MNKAEKSNTSEEKSGGRFLLPALATARFALAPPAITSGLLLVDIASTFDQSIGVMGQMRTTASTLSMIAALIVAVVSVRIRHKPLLLTGLSFIGVSALGCYYAPNYTMMLLAYSLVGVGASMVGPITMALAGDQLPRRDRSRAVGWLLSGNSMSYLIGAPVIAYLAGLGSWRTAFLFWVFPVSLLGIGCVIFGLPSLNDNSLKGENVDITASFKAVLTNRSALSCLVGSALMMASVQAILVYGASFYRQTFLVSRSTASLFVIGDAIFFTLGSVGSARLVNRYGGKPVIVSTSLIGGLCISAYTIFPALWISTAARFFCMLFIGFGLSALNSLILEQVSENRGTLMSINSAITSIGSSLGSFIGGIALLLYGYTLVGVSLGAMAVASAIIIHFLAVDPHKKIAS